MHSAVQARHVGQCDVTVEANSFPTVEPELDCLLLRLKVCPGMNLAGGKGDDARNVLTTARQTLLQQALEVSAECDKHSAPSRPQRQGPAMLTNTDE